MTTDPLSVTPKRVDESWKSQVEQEVIKLSAAPKTTPVAVATAAAAPGGGEVPAADQRFEALVSSLAMEAFVHLGDVPHPATNQPEVNLQQAKYVIDLLGMLEKKTVGNLAPQEAQQLKEHLYQLRMRFAEKTQPPIPLPPGSKEAKR